MRAFLLALQFFTVATLRRDLDAGPRELARSRYWWGVVGGLLGAGLAGLAWLGRGLGLPSLALAGLLVLLWAGLTRMLHLDGLADTADALVHPTSRQRALEIMKDTRLGSFGTAALVLVLLVKFGALASLSWPRLGAALLAAPALARAGASMLSCLLPSARPGQGLGAQASGNGPGDPWPGLVAGASALCLAGLAAGLAGLWAALAVLLVQSALGLWYWRRLGGVTGDTLGAAIELGEAAALLAVCLA